MLHIFSIFLLGCDTPLLKEEKIPYSSSQKKKIETMEFKNKNLKAVLFWIKRSFGGPSKESSFLLHLFELYGISEGAYLYENLYFNMNGV
jgi:hypothetical protein